MNYRYIFNILGKILLVIAFFMMTVLPWIFYFHEKLMLPPFIESISISFTLGISILILTKKHSEELHTNEGYLIVSLTWILMGIVGSLPFYLSQTIPSFVDAFFESVSGFTTTGSSILTNIEALPKSMLYWRSLTNWMGGMGIIVLVIAILPKLKIAGYQFFQMESSGIMPEKIKPRTTDIAKRLWLIYFMLTAILVVLLMVDGINFYESLCHAFGTIATGGFSTKNDSVGHYSSYAQYVIIIFMLLSGINFTLHYYLLKGDFMKVIRNTELKAYLLIIIGVGSLIAFYLYANSDMSFEKSFRDSFFQVVSVITATGFATTDYLKWDDFAWGLIFGLMFVGACVGSTGGGIKVIRHVIAFKSISNAIKKMLHPNSISPIKINGASITEEKYNSILGFITIYLITFFFSSIIMIFLGLDIKTSFGSVLTAMGGIGPGIGAVGPAGNFAHVPVLGKIMLSFLMIIGRLEILTFLVVFTPSYWRK